MRLAIVSDLHLEFRDVHEFYELIKRINQTDCDHVLNAGDLSPGKVMRDFFLSGIKHPNTYVAGNHDYYGSPLDDSHGCITLKGNLRLAYATLWTDFKRNDPLVMNAFPHYMNDGKLIKRRAGDPTSIANQLYKQHVRHFDYIKDKQPDVVMTHHAPSFQSMVEAFKHEFPANYYYFSDYDQFIEDNPKIKLWVHGHTHAPKDYMIGSTRIVCNPLGYPGEQKVDDYQPLIVEV
jgi:predicted phosphodiesterase